jgi:hypothetical protein
LRPAARCVVYVVAAIEVVMAMSAPVGHTQVPVPVCSRKYRAISIQNACRLLERQGHTVQHRNVSKASHSARLLPVLIALPGGKVKYTVNR